MRFESFRQDVLEHGPMFAVSWASELGVPGRVLALWLSRVRVVTSRAA